MARAYTDDAARFELPQPVPTDDADRVEHSFVAVTAHDKLDRLVEHLSEVDGLSLVFVRTKRGADRLATRL